MGIMRFDFFPLVFFHSQKKKSLKVSGIKNNFVKRYSLVTIISLVRITPHLSITIERICVAQKLIFQ